MNKSENHRRNFWIFFFKEFRVYEGGAVCACYDLKQHVYTAWVKQTQQYLHFASDALFYADAPFALKRKQIRGEECGGQAETNKRLKSVK